MYQGENKQNEKLGIVSSGWGILEDFMEEVAFGLSLGGWKQRAGLVGEIAYQKEESECTQRSELFHSTESERNGSKAQKTDYQE